MTEHTSRETDTINERLLVTQAAALSAALKQCRPARLSPFLHQLNNLSSDYQDLANAAIGKQQTGSNPASAHQQVTVISDSPGTSYQSSQSPELASSAEDKHRENAERLVQGALRLIGEIETAAFNYRGPLMSPQFSHGRELHIGNILTFQRRNIPRAASGQEKIVLLCACLSLARDFRDFERRSGWTPKSEMLACGIRSNKPVSVQKIGKHLGHFLASSQLHASTDAASRYKLGAAIRFGIKLQVLDCIATDLQLEPCLSLLLGFECLKCSRLSYSAFVQLRDALAKTDTYNALLRFSCLVGAWWQQRNFEYHSHYSTPVGREQHLATSTGDSTSLIDADWSRQLHVRRPTDASVCTRAVETWGGKTNLLKNSNETRFNSPREDPDPFGLNNFPDGLGPSLDIDLESLSEMQAFPES